MVELVGEWCAGRLGDDLDRVVEFAYQPSLALGERAHYYALHRSRPGSAGLRPGNRATANGSGALRSRRPTRVSGASNPRCANLYRRLGFVTMETVRLFGAPPIQLMARVPG